VQVYGGAAQDFGTYKTAWETYGWSLFKMPAPPTDQDVNWAWIQVSTASRLRSARLAAVYALVRQQWQCFKK